MNRVPTHVGFSDESHTEQGYWTSISMVTMKYTSLAQMEKTLLEQLQSIETKSEIKWTNTKSGWGSEAAKIICEFVVKKAAERELRVDTIIVDKKYMTGTDKKESISKIYYSLLKNVLKCRWGRECVWELCPDENKRILWKNMEDFLERGSEQWLNTVDGIELLKMFDVHDIKPMDSKNKIFLQVADVFAGMAVFSRSQYNKYEAWHGPNQTLDNTRHRKSKEYFRFKLLRDFKLACEKRKFRMSLEGTRGLKTFNPCDHINFWVYEPKPATVKKSTSDVTLDLFSK